MLKMRLMQNPGNCIWLLVLIVRLCHIFPFVFTISVIKFGKHDAEGLESVLILAISSVNMSYYSRDAWQMSINFFSFVIACVLTCVFCSLTGHLRKTKNCYFELQLQRCVTFGDMMR